MIIVPILKPIDEPKMYGKSTKAELIELLEKIQTMTIENVELLKQIREFLE
jgi:hypothetical protein